jgi:mitochondrial enoyl-[acyl-carrier protein] reductase / trans-2-enoyl-CoA reductase
MKRTNFGTWRTHAVAGEDDVLKIEKEGLNATQVGTVGVNPTTAYRMLKDFETLDAEKGDWFIQNGANSGVGRAGIQLGKLWGYNSINVIRDRDTPEATEKMKEELYDLGATKVVTEKELMDRSFSEKVKEWTNGGREKIKVGLNCVGGKPTASMLRNLSHGGTLVTYGGMAKEPLGLPTELLIFKDIKFVGFWVSRWSDVHAVEKKRTVMRYYS